MPPVEMTIANHEHRALVPGPTPAVARGREEADRITSLARRRASEGDASRYRRYSGARSLRLNPVSQQSETELAAPVLLGGGIVPPPQPRKRV